MTDTATEKLRDIRIVYVVAQSGIGKTFVGDYLEIVRGWKHVDGDEIFKNPNSKYKAVKKELDEAYANTNDDAGIGRMIQAWMAYMQALANLTIEGVEAAPETCKGIVVTHCSYFPILRDAFKDHLLEKGANEILTVFLKCDQESHMKSIFQRTQRQAEQAGCTLEDYFRLQYKNGVVDFDSFVKWYKDDYLPPFAPPDPDIDTPYDVVDVTTKDITVIDKIDETFGMSRETSRGSTTYQELVQVIRKRDEERDALWLADFPVPEYAQNDKPEEEEEIKQIAVVEPKRLRARRSSLLEADKMRSIRRLSVVSRRSSISESSKDNNEVIRRLSVVGRSSISERSKGDDGVNVGNRLSSRRRSSFLTTGKIEDILALENLEELLTEEE